MKRKIKHIKIGKREKTILKKNKKRAGATIYSISECETHVFKGFEDGMPQYAILYKRDWYYELPYGYIGDVRAFMKGKGEVKVVEYLV